MDNYTIKEVLAFPAMKPEGAGKSAQDACTLATAAVATAAGQATADPVG